MKDIPDRYIENLEEIIISKDRLIDKLKKRVIYADVSLCVLPHLNLLHKWIQSTFDRLEFLLVKGKAEDALFREKHSPWSNLFEELEYYLKVSDALTHKALSGKWCIEKVIEGCNINNAILRWIWRFNEHPSRQSTIHLKLSLEDKISNARIEEPDAFQIINSIATNSIEALSKRKHPVILIRTLQVGQDIQIEVEDNGPGISENISTKVLTPYFTTKSHQNGPVIHHGLGLHSTVKILDRIGGKLSFTSEPNSSTTFKILIPAISDEKKIISLEQKIIPDDEVSKK